jgi:hypothetical protein
MEAVCDNSFCELNITILDKSSELYLKCLEEVQVISSATLFAPVVGCEAVVGTINGFVVSGIHSISDDQYFTSFSSCVWLV